MRTETVLIRKDRAARIRYPGEPGSDVRSETAKSLPECKAVSLHGLMPVGYRKASDLCESV